MQKTKKNSQHLFFSVFFIQSVVCMGGGKRRRDMNERNGGLKKILRAAIYISGLGNIKCCQVQSDVSIGKVDIF